MNDKNDDFGVVDVLDHYIEAFLDDDRHRQAAELVRTRNAIAFLMEKVRTLNGHKSGQSISVPIENFADLAIALDRCERLP